MVTTYPVPLRAASSPKVGEEIGTAPIHARKFHLTGFDRLHGGTPDHRHLGNGRFARDGASNVPNVDSARGSVEGSKTLPYRVIPVIRRGCWYGEFR